MHEHGSEPALANWTSDRIDENCEAAYDDYVDHVRHTHVAYFATRPERKSATHAFGACSREAAFPDGWEHLAQVLAPGAWHRHHRSAGSSQVLALALLAAATRADSSLGWLSAEVSLGNPLTLFEVEIADAVLNERPRQTSLDWLVIDHHDVIAAEAKFTERGLGQCSCKRRTEGQCSERVLERPYWEVAARDLRLKRQPAGQCSLGLGYQAVRNVAAAQAIAGERRRSTFLLLYDARNPYFSGARAWPGWVKMLAQQMRGSRTLFLSLSWQELLMRVDLASEVENWAHEKHGL
jgi:hypothetical protein